MTERDGLTNDEIDDLVSEWHDGPTEMMLADFLAVRLGWTVDDVNRWAASSRYRPGDQKSHDLDGRRGDRPMNLDEVRGRWERGEGWPAGVHYNVTAEQDVRFLLDLIAGHDADRDISAPNIDHLIRRDLIEQLRRSAPSMSETERCNAADAMLAFAKQEGQRIRLTADREDDPWDG